MSVRLEVGASLATRPLKNPMKVAISLRPAVSPDTQILHKRFFRGGHRFLMQLEYFKVQNLITPESPFYKYFV